MGFFSKIKTLFTSEPIEQQKPQEEIIQEKIEEVQEIPESTTDSETSEPAISTTPAELSSSEITTENIQPTEVSDPLTLSTPVENLEISTPKANVEIEIPTESIEVVTTSEISEPIETVESEVLAEPTPAHAPEAQQTASSLSTTDEKLLIALRQSEQKLSSWLTIVLQSVSEKGDLLNSRINFLLKSLDIPQNEIEAFLKDFNQWLDNMEYQYLDEFRSELQYRLSLALDLEDEEDERDRLMLKLNSSLTKTREQLLTGINALFSQHSNLDAAFWDELEELFIMSDMGYESAQKLVSILKKAAIAKNIDSPKELLPLFAEEVEKLFTVHKRIEAVNPPEVILMVGVNGVGKTTTIAKLAHRSKMQGKKVLIAAADTFRAAAIEQLQVWADRIGVDFTSKIHGSDPAAVAFEAMDKALAGGYDIVYIDTAGRLHTKTGLMDELTKIKNVINKKHPGAPHRIILVIDATTGQNALQQTKLFIQSAQVSEIILTKLDGTAKGGVALAIASMFQTPITYVGLGEKLEDLRPFNPHDFAKALFDIKE